MRLSLAFALAIALGSSSLVAAQSSERVIFPDHLRLRVPAGIAVSECGPKFQFGGGDGTFGDCLKSSPQDAPRLRAKVAEDLIAAGWVAVSDKEFLLRGPRGCSLVAIVALADAMKGNRPPSDIEQIDGVVTFFYVPTVACEASK